jgi:8-oxo-dGTP pyrophosphatase MutT (NUDIX family)
LQQQPQVRKWDRVVRNTKHSETSVDAVVIWRHHSNNDNNWKGGNDEKIVCVKQYRPPVNSFTLELPAGLIDLDDSYGNHNDSNKNNKYDGDDRTVDGNNTDSKNHHHHYDAAVKSAAIRELTEETGYIGTVTEMTTTTTTVGLLPTYLSPGLTNECACLMQLDVDMTNEQNLRVYNNYMKGIHHGDDNDYCGNGSSSGMEESERERKLTTVLFPKVGLLAALQEYVQKNKRMSNYYLRGCICWRWACP